MQEVRGKTGSARLFEYIPRAISPQDAHTAHPGSARELHVRLAVPHEHTFCGRNAQAERGIARERRIGLAGEHARITADKIEKVGTRTLYLWIITEKEKRKIASLSPKSDNLSVVKHTKPE